MKIKPTSFKKQLCNQCLKDDRFWFQLGSILGGFWFPNRSQIGTKSHSTSLHKMSNKMIPFRIASKSIFEGFWPPIWEPKRGPRNAFWSFLFAPGPSWGLHGAKMAPRRLQNASRSPPRGLLEASWHQFWWILASDLLDFGPHVGGFWTPVDYSGPHL